MADQDICRLSELPESLVYSDILSRLSLSDVVRSSILCSQWRYNWTRIPYLHFSPHFFTHMRWSVRRRGILGREAITHIKETMEHILINHKAPLECFLLYIPNKFFRNGLSRRFIEAMDIKECIDTVAQKGVERMFLEAVAHPWQKKVSLPVTIFGCKTLLHLQLVGFIFPEIPTLVENFKLLRVCVLANIQNLTEHRLQRLVELCTVLEKLVLVSCQEFIHLKIQATNLNCLILAGCSSLESLTANCPQLLLLKTRKVLKLQELQINSYSLVELNIN
ncbi:putative F-box/FBD/LRR-repeat protein At5g22610 [Cryptomeria japonica]|uniref:putative F-box/FBD/LRR-repeat protein At5g22610 n=1 Tax=Cryptomeria japonica TaxID=3369 RepID=UPI0027DA27AB|nr:putative F-box/FBD/LRR-repeat protein At5g22610 [Cryptomeria japonica]